VRCWTRSEWQRSAVAMFAPFAGQLSRWMRRLPLWRDPTTSCESFCCIKWNRGGLLGQVQHLNESRIHRCRPRRPYPSPQNITEWCSKHSWDQSACRCIMEHESGGNANALNQNTGGSYDVGLWQVNT
jgi:hypothetical protein